MQVLKGELPARDGARREPDCDPNPHLQGSVSSLKKLQSPRVIYYISALAANVFPFLFFFFTNVYSPVALVLKNPAANARDKRCRRCGFNP